MAIPDDTKRSFQEIIREILEIPAVFKKDIAAWAEVDASTVTRWCQGMEPSNPVAILRRLQPHIERAREEATSAAKGIRKTEIDLWRTLVGDMGQGLKDHISQSGLLASAYYVFMIWDPGSVDQNECDVVILRYFSGVWADLSRRLYNVGDLTQTVSWGSDDGKETGRYDFDQKESIGSGIELSITTEKLGQQALARISFHLDLDGYASPNDAIAFIKDFGYRYRATKSIVAQKPEGLQQTNEFLGAPVVIPCRRFNLVVCIPRGSFVGSPDAFSFSNRAMLPLLLQLDKTPRGEIESMLWPLGRSYELSSSPDVQLMALPHADSMIERLPVELQNVLAAPIDLERKSPSLQQVLCGKESSCFLLDLHLPNPSLIHSIVWRLQ